MSKRRMQKDVFKKIQLMNILVTRKAAEQTA